MYHITLPFQQDPIPSYRIRTTHHLILPKSIQTAAEALLQQQLGHTYRVTGFHPVSGGCINAAGRLDTDQGPFFIKWNSATAYPGMFAAEQAGMEALYAPQVIRVPQMIGVGEAGGEAFLIMEWLESAPQQSGFFTLFGQQLAALHRHTHIAYGFAQDNYIGSLPQSNTWQTDWVTFMIEERFEPQLQHARNDGFFDRTTVQQFERLYKALPDLLPDEPPSLLHGDLWSGNYLVGPEGEPCLVDPAVYYGHREMEIAFTGLFGGYPASFYHAYEAAWPLTPGFADRKDIYHLYPLLVHVNLFGSSYVGSVQSIIRQF